MTITITTILTSIGTIVTYLVGKEFLLPQVIQLWQFLFDRKVNKENHELDNKHKEVEIREANNNMYEGQIEFLMQQVKDLQERDMEKEEREKKYIAQVKELQEEVVKLNEKIYKQNLIISKLQSLCCQKIDCKVREICDCEQQ